MKPNTVIKIFTIVACLCVASGVLLYSASNQIDDHRLPFDAEVWKRDTAMKRKYAGYQEVYRATRDLMVNDLVRQVNLIGKTKPEITDLLGIPDYPHSKDWEGWDLIYWPGPDDRGPMGHLDSK